MVCAATILVFAVAESGSERRFARTATRDREDIPRVVEVAAFVLLCQNRAETRATADSTGLFGSFLVAAVSVQLMERHGVGSIGTFDATRLTVVDASRLLDVIASIFLFLLGSSLSSPLSETNTNVL